MIVELHGHDPRWANQASAEASRLSDALGGNLVRIEHVGSTAIPGIWAKPVIDLMPIIRSLAAVDEKREALEALGYEWYGECGIPDRRYCTLTHPETGKRLVNVHIFKPDSPHAHRLLEFRDYLRVHPEKALECETEKRRAAALYPDDVLAYNDAKSVWIKACEIQAVQWWTGRSAYHER